MSAKKSFITPPFIAGLTASVLAVIKLVFGLSSGSMAVVSSALDSLGDCLVSAINFFALKKASAQPNEKFNFGYGKIEALTTLFEGFFIMAAGLFVAYGGVMKILNPEPIDFGIGAVVMVISLVMTTALVIYLRHAAAKYDSMIIYADATHYQVDLLTNAATLAALIVVHFSGLVIIDALFGIGVSAYIVLQAMPLIKESVYMLLDGSLPTEVTDEIKELIAKKELILSTHLIRTRKSGNICYFGVHLVFDPNITLAKAHECEAELEKEIKERFSQNKWIFEIHFDITDDEEIERGEI